MSFIKKIKGIKSRSVFVLGFFILLQLPKYGYSQVLQPDINKTYYLIHSSGNLVAENNDGRAIIAELSGNQDQLLQFIPDGTGYYSIKLPGQQKYMALSGSWNTYFVIDSTTNNSKYVIEEATNTFVKLKCKANGKYLGTDNTTIGSNIYSDKSGSDSNHFWYISEKYTLPVDSMTYLVNPNAEFGNSFEGWGVSLCWWANMCGSWSDAKIDEIVDWLVSPEGLNYNIFRYNIGGGDDPLNRNCTPHHMANGKGLRAEMEGFKDSLNANYDWSSDAAQRKIMLKIKEKRPDAIFEAFSNSAPYYMTYSGCSSGNFSATDDNLKPEFYDEFAHYLIDVCKFYKDSLGIEFKTLEPFNEPVTNYWAANGGQEGCHFSTGEQINFLKVLSPILKASGLQTIISASDESNLGQSVIDFKDYISDGTVLDLVDQWNTHSYSGNNTNRANIRALATVYKKRLWMSEVGAGGTGISGNLNLAQKLMNDIRYLRPEAWIDWQYIEENNDQWCTVNASFTDQTYNRVKNYYVRKQLSHYVKVGYKFLSVPNDNILASLSPSKDSLTLVLLNTSNLEVHHTIDLSLFDQIDYSIEATRTSETENNTAISNFELKSSQLTIALAPNSITTLVIPVGVSILDNQIKTNQTYLIIPRTASLVMHATDNAVELRNFKYTDSLQLWQLKSAGTGYFIQNLKGEYLTDEDTYFAKTTLSENSSNQTFFLEPLTDDCFKIISNYTRKALDLEGENNTSGTKIGFYPYGNSPAASHRQWQFVLPPKSSQDILGIIENTKKDTASRSIRIYGTSGEIVVTNPKLTKAQVKIYGLTGAKILQKNLKKPYSRFPIHPGIYIVLIQFGVNSGHKTEVTKVLVK